MTDTRLLYDAFNIYYNKGMDALKEDNYSMAKRNILAAAETLLKLAKNSTGTLKAERVKRAEELNGLVSKIEDKEKCVPLISDDAFNCESNLIEHKYNVASIEDSFRELYSLEGLNEVKEQVSDLVDQIKVFQIRKKYGIPNPEMSHHMVFTGNPGTGKTTVARIIGQIYCALGILSKGHLVEVDRGDLVAGYVGQTALKTKEIINKSMGGVLFIDEAYSLKKEGNDFGQEAIDTLNKLMEDSRGDLIVIIAGYEKEIKDFIESNQGLKSRFRTYINFSDYTYKELHNIFLGICKKNQYSLNNEANDIIFSYLKNRKKDKYDGNARDVRNLFENIIKLQSRRIAKIKSPTKEDITTITLEDLPLYVRENKLETNQEEKNEKKDLQMLPENIFMDNYNETDENKFEWDDLPSISFADIAGLENVKEIVKNKVLLPLQYPLAYEGYFKKNGGGLFLYGPPGTGKTMIAAAIAKEIGAKFCSINPSSILKQGIGKTEKAIRSLFDQARQYSCSVIYFDEIDSIAPKSTRAQFARQLRSEFLSQLQGIESYSESTNNILFVIASTNKPWDVDSAFIRPGRFGTKVYVGLPDYSARKDMINIRLNKIKDKGVVSIYDDIDIESITERTNGFNCSDITNLLDRVDEISIIRGIQLGNKYICKEDFDLAFKDVHSSVLSEDIEKLMEWRANND